MEDIDNVIKRSKELESHLKIFGLENVKMKNKKFIKNNEIRMFELEIERSDQKYNIIKMESNNAKLQAEIEKSRKAIQLLSECLGGKLNVAEMNKAAEKTQVMIQKLNSKQYSNEHPILEIMQKVKELEDLNKS